MLDAPQPKRDVAPQLDELLESFEPDVVHVHNVMRADVLAWAAERGAIATVQDHRSFCPGSGKLTLAREVCREPMSSALCAGCFEDRGYHERIQRVTEDRARALRDMRALTVLSHYMSGELVGIGVDAARVVVIPPFVHGLDTQATPDGEPCVLFAGRLVATKGADDALAAWQQAGGELPLVIAGSGSLRQQFEARPTEGGRVDVLGWLPHERMAALYARARVLLMPSRWQEPFGIVGLEALAMGVPVVAWESGGVREWHPGGPLLVAWGDRDALSAALASALREPPAVSMPAGFERKTLTDRLLATYSSLAS
jgi:glycosyltransferase involved in cell wall biosynthesis